MLGMINGGNLAELDVWINMLLLEVSTVIMGGDQGLSEAVTSWTMAPFPEATKSTD